MLDLSDEDFDKAYGQVQAQNAPQDQKVAPPAAAPAPDDDFDKAYKTVQSKDPRDLINYHVDKFNADPNNKIKVDPDFAYRIADQESEHFHPDVLSGKRLSPKGAIGMFQLMPGTAQRLGVNPRDPVENVRGGVNELGRLLNQYNGDQRLAAAGYNAGEGAVAKYGGDVPNYQETKDYVAKTAGDDDFDKAYQQMKTAPEDDFDKAYAQVKGETTVGAPNRVLGTAGAQVAPAQSSFDNPRKYLPKDKPVKPVAPNPNAALIDSLNNPVAVPSTSTTTGNRPMTIATANAGIADERENQIQQAIRAASTKRQRDAAFQNALNASTDQKRAANIEFGKFGQVSPEEAKQLGVDQSYFNNMGLGLAQGGADLLSTAAAGLKHLPIAGLPGSNGGASALTPALGKTQEFFNTGAQQAESERNVIGKGGIVGDVITQGSQLAPDLLAIGIIGPEGLAANTAAFSGLGAAKTLAKGGTAGQAFDSAFGNAIGALSGHVLGDLPLAGKVFGNAGLGVIITAAQGGDRRAQITSGLLFGFQGALAGGGAGKEAQVLESIHSPDVQAAAEAYLNNPTPEGSVALARAIAGHGFTPDEGNAVVEKINEAAQGTVAKPDSFDVRANLPKDKESASEATTGRPPAQQESTTTPERPSIERDENGLPIRKIAPIPEHPIGEVKPGELAGTEQVKPGAVGPGQAAPARKPTSDDPALFVAFSDAMQSHIKDGASEDAIRSAGKNLGLTPAEIDHYIKEADSHRGPAPVVAPTDAQNQGQAIAFTEPVQEDGITIEHGKPVTLGFIRSTERAPQMGSDYGQDVEPAGRYLSHDEDINGKTNPGWERGQVTFKNPLVIEANTNPEGARYDQNGWKARLSEQYGGKTGKELTDAIKADGHDGIVTVEPSRGKMTTSEIVDLTDKPEVKPNEQPAQNNPVAPDFDHEVKTVSDALNDDNHPFSRAIDDIAAGDTSDEAIAAARAAGKDFDPATLDDAIDAATRVAHKQPTESPEPRTGETPAAESRVEQPGQTVEPPKPPEFEPTGKRPPIDENRHWNFKRSQFSSAESEANFRDLIKKTVAENGEAHKTRVTQKDFVARANEIDPELAKEAIKNYKPGDPVPSREIFHAAAEYAQNNIREAGEIRQMIKDGEDTLSPAQRQKLETEADRLEHDAKEAIGGAIGVRSEFGRNLALLATTKMDVDSPANMIRRADAAAKARGDDLTGKNWQIQRKQIMDQAVRLEQAKMRESDLLKQLSEAPKAKRKSVNEDVSLSTFVRKRGGFKSDKDLQGEINRFRSKESGTTGLFSKKGLSPDYMREAAVEAGYLPEDATIDDLMEKLQQDMSGKKVYSTQRDAGLYDKELGQQYKKANPEEFQTWQQRFTGKLDKLEQEARARLSESLNPNTHHDITDLPRMAADLAIILASKLAKKGIALTEMRKEMTDEFGEHFTQDQDRIEKAALEIHNDQRLEALTEAAKVPNKEVRKSALAELKGEVSKREQAERKATKEADDVKKNLVKFNAESRLEAAKNAEAAERKATAAEARAQAVKVRDEQRYQEVAANRGIRSEQFEKEQSQKAKSQELGAAETDAQEARRQADKFNAESKQQQAKAEEAFRKQQDAADARDAAKKARQAQREAEVNEQKGIRQEAVNAKKAAAQEANPVYQLGVEAKATELRLNQPGEVATVDDLSKIGAAKLHEPGMTPSRWTAEMQKFGKSFTENQREIRDGAAKLSADAKDQVKTQQDAKTAAASYAYRLAIKQGRTEAEAKAAARNARNNAGQHTQEQIDQLKELYNQARTERMAAQRALAKNFANLEETTLEKVSSAIKIGLISGIRTLGKIVASHGSYAGMEAAAKIPASVADMIQSALNGNERQAGGLTLDMLKSAARAGIKRGIPDAMTKLRTGYFPEGEDIYSRAQGASNPLEAREIHFNSNSKVLDAYSKVLNGIMRVHGAVYSVHRVAMVDMALKEQSALVAKTEAKAALKAGKIQRSDVADYARMRAEDLYKNPPETLAATAIGAAEESSFVNENLTNQFIKGAKNMAGKVPGVGPVLKFGIDRLAPYSKVPANVAARTIEGFGPVSIPYAFLRLGLRALQEKGYTPEMQAQFSKTIGRGTVGTLGPVLLGYALASKGYQTGFIQDYDKKGSTRILGRQWRTSAVPPFGTLMALGATIYELQHSPVSTSTPAGKKVFLKELGGAALDTVAEQPMVHELHTFDELSSAKDLGHAANKFAGGFAGQVVPTIVSDTAAQIDRTKRQKDSIMDYVNERIPFWRSTLPVSKYPGIEPNKLFDPFSSIPAPPKTETDRPNLRPFMPKHK